MIQKLREKIIEAVPEIMELKMGCRFNWGKQKCTVVSLPSMQFASMKHVVMSFLNEGDALTRSTAFNFDNIEILGRPITLFDFRKLLKDDDFVKLSNIWTGNIDDLKDVDISWLLSVMQ